jgi:hypothetical protein
MYCISHNSIGNNIITLDTLKMSLVAFVLFNYNHIIITLAALLIPMITIRNPARVSKSPSKR